MKIIRQWASQAGVIKATLFLLLLAIISLTPVAGSFTHVADCHFEDDCDSNCDCDRCHAQSPMMVFTGLDCANLLPQVSWHSPGHLDCYEQQWSEDIEHPPQFLL